MNASFSLRDRNFVLQKGRKLKGKVKIFEEFTEKVKLARKNLSEFARNKSKETKYDSNSS